MDPSHRATAYRDPGDPEQIPCAKTFTEVSSPSWWQRRRDIFWDVANVLVCGPIALACLIMLAIMLR